MQYLGFFLVVVAIVGIIYGITQQMKAKKILAAPFKKTAEVASNPQAADAKGSISCEGAIQTQQPVMAPCSGRPAVYVEIEVVRLWEKYVQTENGMKTEKGKDTVSTAKQGSHFYLNDGSGPCGVDMRESVDCDLEQTFEQVQNVSSGDVIFGQFRAHVPYDGSDKRTTGIRATEKIVPAQGNLFVMGKLAAGTVTKTDGLLGKLLASTKGRDKLIGATKRNALIGFIAGGVMFAGGVPMSIFGDPPVDHCANLADAAGDVCGGHITNDSGETYTWTVTKPGTYKVEVLQPNVKIPIIPVLQISDEAGARVLPADTTADEKVESIETAFKAGKYKINVRDAAKGDAAKFKGGFSFKLNIVSTGVAPADSGSGAPAASGAPAMTGSAAKPALTAGTPVKPTTPTTTAKPAVTAVAKPPVAKPTPAPVKKK
jgi:hypothetical protein